LTTDEISGLSKRPVPPEPCITVLVVANFPERSILKRFLIQIRTWKISMPLWTRQLVEKNQYYSTVMGPVIYHHIYAIYGLQWPALIKSL